MRGFLSPFSLVFLIQQSLSLLPSGWQRKSMHVCLHRIAACDEESVSSYAFHSMRIKRKDWEEGFKVFQQYHLCIICEEGGERILVTVVAWSMKKTKMKVQTIEPGGSCVSIFCCFCDIFILYLQKQDLMWETWRLKSQRQRWQESWAHFIYYNIALTSGPDHSLLSWDAISGINLVLTFNLCKSCQCPSCLLGISLVMYTLLCALSWCSSCLSFCLVSCHSSLKSFGWFQC